VLFSSSAFAASQKTYHIKVAHYIPATISVSKVRIKWFDELAKRSNGRIKVQHFWSGSLAGAKDIPDYLKNNIAQAGSVGFGYRPELFKLIRAADLPFLSARSDALARATSELVSENKGLTKEFVDNGLKPLCLEVAERSPIASRKAALSVKEMKGWKVRAYGQFAAIIQSWGATPVSMPFSDIPEALERGVIDASTAIYFTSYYGLKLPEIINYAIDTGERFATFIGMCMSLKFYNSLPDDLKGLVDEMAKTSWKFWAEKYAEEVNKNAKLLAKTKMKFITWKPNAVKQAKQLCVPAAEKMYFDEMKKRGVEAQAKAIYKELSARTKKYESKSILPYSFQLVEKYRK
jgi:TRAP-type C4-dicarboxylate transport system substrate-binding protein